MIEWWEAGDHAAAIDGMDDYRVHKPRGFGHYLHYLMMAGALGGRACVARAREFSDYKNASGTGQAHVWFDVPVTGWS